MSRIPVEVPTGAIRYNTDSNKMECFNGTKWFQISVSESSPIATRGVLAGGYTPSDWVNTIDFINMSSSGDATNFGDLTEKRGDFSGTISSRTRGCFAGGYYPSGTVRYNGGGCDSGSYGDRGIVAGGYMPGVSNSDIIDYCTISSTGDFTDFGNLIAIWGEQAMASNGFS